MTSYLANIVRFTTQRLHIVVVNRCIKRSYRDIIQISHLLHKLLHTCYSDIMPYNITATLISWEKSTINSTIHHKNTVIHNGNATDKTVLSALTRSDWFWLSATCWQHWYIYTCSEYTSKTRTSQNHICWWCNLTNVTSYLTNIV